MAFTLLYVLSWLGMAVQFSFAVMSIATGLYYLAELIEEYTVKAKKIARIMVWAVIVLDVALWLVDGFPNWMILSGLGAHICLSALLSTFPFISITAPPFIGGCLLLVLAHVTAFWHFSANWYPFSEVLAYFTFCLWLVPFTFFLSLSANDNVLPTLGSGGVVALDGEDSKLKITRRSGFLQLTDWFKQLFTSDGRRSSKSM